MTDLSGSRIVTGFDSYLSAYALGPSGRYAIAKTWYAPECERPGCVWTQVLLFTSEVWARTCSEHVMQAFRRPKDIKRDSNWYTRPAALGSHRDYAPVDVRASEDLCGAVYASKNIVIVQSVGEDQSVDSLLLEMLWQRPPGLREAFSFCTGALSFLKIDDRPLRVQVMPTRVAKALRETGLTILDLEGRSKKEYGASIRLMGQDLIRRDSQYREFLEEVAAGWEDVPELMASDGMALFTDAYIALRENSGGINQDVAAVVGLAARLPPHDPRFKNVLARLGASLDSPRAAWVYIERVFTGEFGDTLLAEPSVAQVARTAAIDDPIRALGLVREHLYGVPAATAKRQALDGLLNGISLDVLSGRRPVEPQVLLAWVRHHPESLPDSRFWLLQSSFDESAEIAEALSEMFSESSVLQALLRADRFDLLLMLLRAQGREGARKAYMLAGELDVHSVNDLLRLNALREEVAMHAEYVVDVCGAPGHLTSHLYVLGSSHLSSRRLLELFPSASTWIEALAAIGRVFDRLQVRAFQLAIEQRGWWEVAELAFIAIYERAASREFPYEDWSALKKMLPKVGGWEKWDKCERLRRAFLDILRRDGRDVEALTTVDYSLKNLLYSSRSKYH